MTTQQAVIVVRSEDRYLGTSGASFAVNLPTTFNNVSAISLQSVELPYTFPNIPLSYCSNVTFTETQPSQISASYSITEAYWDVNSLCSNLLSFLQTTFPDLSISAVNYNTLTGIISITIGNSSGVLSVSKGAATKPGLCYVLGVSPTSTTTSSGGVLTMPNAANLCVNNMLLFQISNLPFNVVSTNSGIGLFRIQLSSGANTVLFVDAASNVGNSVVFNSPITSLSALTITIVNADNTALNLRGGEWTFSIKITYTQ